MFMMLSNLRFVRCAAQSEAEAEGDEGGILQRAVEAVRKKGVEPQWEGPGISKTDKGLVYVVDNFDCSDFKLLLGKCRVIGPAVVLAHVNKGWPLPASTQPMFSMAMRGVVACFTQTGAREDREKLSQLVKLMGGKVQKDYTKHVTHLIAGQVGSTKYNVARDRGMQVMLPSWVEHCWKQGLDSYISALDSTILKAHLCPPFTGCTVTVTGLEERERKKVREVVENNGGVYSGELTKDICTHLLVGSTTSAKYKFAQQWQIYCVSPQWLYDSAERGYCQSEEPYSVDAAATGTGGSGRGRQKTDKASVGPPEWAVALKEYQLPPGSEPCFLDGCRIYLAGFSDQELEKLHKIINLGGGARYNHLSENLTHVVLGAQDPTIVANIRKLAEIPHVVSVLWLLECCTSKDRVEEGQYVCLDLSPTCEEEDKSGVLGKWGGKRKRTLEEDREGGGAGNKRPRMSGGAGEGDRRMAEETMMEEKELLLQYQNAEFPVAAEEEGEERRKGKGVIGEADLGKEGCGVLVGIDIAVSCLFSPDDQTLATSILKEQGGVVVRPMLADYLLSPLEVVGRTGERMQEEHSSHATPVTMIWLQRSIEAGKALEPHSNFLFQPMSTNIVDNTLTGCVLAFSQFPDLEREHLIRFSKGLGAVVQDYFTHYPGHGLLATTHIVLKTAEGEKYDHAVKWGVPAVADSWLFACAMSSGIVPVDQHLVRLVTPPPNTRAGEDLVRAECEGVKRTEEKTEGPDGLIERESITSNEQGPPPAEETHFKRVEGESEEDKCGEDLQEEKETEERESVLAGVVVCLHKKISDQAHMHNLAGSLGADCHWTFDHACTHYIYQGKAAEAMRDREVRAARDNGCVIVSPHWILACVAEGRRVEETSYPHTYNPNMTLNIWTSTQQRRDVTLASEAESQETQAHTVQGGTEVASGEREGERTREGGRQEEEVSSKQTESREEDAAGEDASITSDVVRKFQQQLEEIKVAPREARRRRSRRLQQKEPEPGGPAKAPPSPLLSSRLRRSRRNRKEESLTDSQISDSQVLQVTYDDPEGRREKAKLLARIEREEEMRAQGLDPAQFRDSSSVEDRTLRLDLLGITHSEVEPTTRGECIPRESNRNGQQTNGTSDTSDGKSKLIAGFGATDVCGVGDKDKDKDAPSSTPLPPPLGMPIVTHSKGRKEVRSLFDETAMQTRRRSRPPPKFLLSSLEQREKVDYGALIQELGGEYIDLDYFTTSCTHLVVGKASRTEKFLGACAAGKWVLHKSYMESCRAERRFVEEDEHEWGVNGGGNEPQSLEYAPRRWRVALAAQRMADGGETICGAFHGWKALLFAERNKMAGLKRLLEAGGATVYTSGNKLSTEELRQVSHAFINMSYFPKDSLSLEVMVQCGVSCLKPDYIAEYLSKGKDVPIEPFFINEVKPLLKRHKE